MTKDDRGTTLPKEVEDAARKGLLELAAATPSARTAETVLDAARTNARILRIRHRRRIAMSALTTAAACFLTIAAALIQRPSSGRGAFHSAILHLTTAETVSGNIAAADADAVINPDSDGDAIYSVAVSDFFAESDFFPGGGFSEIPQDDFVSDLISMQESPIKLQTL